MTRPSPGWRALIALGTLFAVIFFIPFVVAIFGRTQSGEGTRSGVVVKLSYKGRFNKSWEGELMLGSVQSGATWDFSLDPADPQTPQLANALRAAELSATPVTLRYVQHFIGPWSTDTNYLVIGQVPETTDRVHAEPRQ